MSLEDETVELSLVYHGTREYVEELERGMEDCNTKIAALEEIINGLFEIAPACPTRIALWRRYQGLAAPKQRKSPQEPLEGMSGI